MRFVSLRCLVPICLAVSATLPWLYLRLAGFEGGAIQEAALAGLAIVGAAFLLAWAAELANLEISAALAVAILALVAVLPEYAVDIYFAWQAGQDPTFTQYAVANMTGSNRLLIGVGWTAVAMLYWFRTRRRVLHLGPTDRLELGALTFATLYAASIPLRSELSLVDTVVLVTLFVLYIRGAARQGVETPHLVGPAEALSHLPRGPRRLVTILLFVYAAAAVLLSAEAFAEGLVGTGKLLGLDEFLLVQWLAPLASEAPEFIVACLFALTGRANVGLRTMISSKVNQWTLLIGMLPLAYALSSGSLTPMPMDARQVQEVLLTVAQSFFAVIVLAKLRFSLGAAITLAVLFFLQLLVPAWRGLFSTLYFGLGLGALILEPARVRSLITGMGTLFGRATPGEERESV
jgi:cation:H+ antiporter